MVTDTVATYTQQALGHEFGQAFLVLSCVFCGWCASGVMIRLLSSASDKTAKGSECFRQEVAALAAKSSVEEAAAHSGLDTHEVRKCRDEALFRWCIENVASWLWGVSKPLDEEPEPEEADEYAFTETFCSDPHYSNPGLALLEHYGVFGAENGAWAGPLH